MTGPADRDPAPASHRRMWPLYAAGFTTAVGTHAIAADLAGFTSHRAGSLLVLGGRTELERRQPVYAAVPVGVPGPVGPS